MTLINDEAYNSLIFNATKFAGRESSGYFMIITLQIKIGGNKCEIATSIVEKNETNQRKKNFGNSKSTIGLYRLNQQEKVL